MLVFPQLSTGAIAQYPIRRRRVQRTVRNEFADGRGVKLADTGAMRTEWRLAYEGLTDEELRAIQEFFAVVEGRLNGFTFLDPAGNLLEFSEKLDDPVWQRNSLLAVTSGTPDPLGTSRGSRLANTGGATLEIVQEIEAPGWYYYCFSTWARSDEARRVGLRRGGDVVWRPLRREWQRLTCSGQSETTEETIAFGLAVEAGATVEVFGFQAEAQTGASAYVATKSRAGVYQRARLGEDRLGITTLAPDRHSCVLSVVHADHF